jgi:nitrite reductase/ring-hydroxylating ferredoxin subunit/uncharacterized membrane protein
MFDSTIRAIERSQTLDDIGQRVGGFVAKVLRPGFLKDLLSGTQLGHPLHPMLTDIPIGAWTSAFLLDLLPEDRGSAAADMLIGAGVVSALPTALSGLSDLTDVTEDPDRRIGTAHAIANVAAVALYGLSYFARKSGSRGLGKQLSFAAAGVVSGAGFLGGHLAYRRGLGVDQTIFEPKPSEWTAVMDHAALALQKPEVVTLQGTPVLLYRTSTGVTAIADRCSHRGGPLHEGDVEGECVICPWHASMFRLDDGSIVRGPATAPQPAYDVRVVDGKIELRARDATDS